MKVLALFALATLCVVRVYSQSTLPLRADTVTIEKVGGNANLKLKDASRDSVGGIYVNIGGGVLRAIRTKKVNDTTYIIGLDTIHVGAGATSTMDSVLFATNYRLDTVKNNLRALISTKLNISDTTNKWVNSLRRRGGTDTVEMFKNGSWQPVYKDSVGSSGSSGTLTQVNTGYGLSGGPITTTGIIVADTSSGNSLATKNFVSSRIWPSEISFGKIYSKKQFTLNDFEPNVVGSPTTQLSLSNGYLRYTVSSIDWNNWTRILPNRPTILPWTTMEVYFKQITAPASNTVGFGIGFKSAISQNNDVLCYVNTTNSGSSGDLTITQGDGSPTYNSGSGSGAINQNDVIKLRLEFKDSVLSISSQNITQGTALSTPVQYSFPIGSGNIIPTICNWAFIGHSAIPCTWEVQQIEIYSNTKRNANLYVIGDSKTQLATADYYASSYGWQLKSLYPTTVVYAAAGAETYDFTNLREELAVLNGQKYILSLGSNELRHLKTLDQLKESYTKLVAWLKSGGAEVYHIVIPEDSTSGHAGIGLSAFNQWVKNTYGSDYIDVYTGMSTGNVLKTVYNADDVHPNQAGHNYIATTIIGSGKITTAPINRYTQVRITDNNITQHGDSLSLFPIDKRENRVNHWTKDGSFVPGIIYDDGTFSGVNKTTKPFNPISGADFNVMGALGINSSTGGLIFADRDDDPSVAKFSIYSSGNKIRLFDNVNGHDHHLYDNNLKTIFYNNTIATSIINPTATMHILGPVSGSGIPALKIDSGVLLTTPQAYAIEATADSIYWTNYSGQRVALNRAGSGLGGVSSINSQTGSIQTFANGTGITVNSSGNVHTIALNSSYVASGTYTPTLSNGANVASSTAYPCQYIRVGNVVTVSGKIFIDYTSAGVATFVGISLPIASSISNDYEIAGAANAESSYGSIEGDAANDYAVFHIGVPSSASYNYFFTFTYQIL
jgi:lysophospholipase L1-like esterase